MTAVMIHTCPSGECQEYTYPPGYWDGAGMETGDLLPRPVEVVIHTREAFDECDRLSWLMGRDDTCADCKRAAREYENERAWIGYHYGGGWMARD